MAPGSPSQGISEMKIFGWLLIALGLAISFGSASVLSVWPARFRWDWQEWQIGFLGLVMASVGVYLVAR
jgi:hypothetical protein